MLHLLALLMLQLLTLRLLTLRLLMLRLLVQRLLLLQLFPVELLTLLAKMTPGAADAVEATAPPLVKVRVVTRLDLGRLVEHGAQPAEEVSVDEATRFLPLKVLIVERVVLIEQVQVLGQLLGTGKVVHVDERVLRRVLLVVDARCPHHYGQNIGSKNNIEKKGKISIENGLDRWQHTHKNNETLILNQKQKPKPKQNIFFFKLRMDSTDGSTDTATSK